MGLLRPSARWTSQVSLKSSRTIRGSNYRQSWQSAQRRAYSSTGGEAGQSTHKSSSDLPWAIGSIAVTVPSVWYLIQPQLQPKKSHGQGHGDEHGKDSHDKHNNGEEGEGSEGDEGVSEGQEEKTGATENGDEEKDEDSEDQGSAKMAPATPGDKGPDGEAYETEGGGNVEGVKFKGSTSGGSKEGEQGDTRKHVPDAKGGSKKRIESDYGNKMGEATQQEQDADNKDMGAASKPTKGAGSSSSQSSKQEGLSNTDTKHSLGIQNDPAKSKKGEGVPESAKLKGTVDPSRKQV